MVFDSGDPMQRGGSSEGSFIAVGALNVPHTPWNRLRRGWKEFAQGWPEDELVQAGRGADSRRAVLYGCVLALLMVPPVAGLAMSPRSGWIRAAVLAAVSAGLLAASQLEVERRRRGTFIVPLVSGLLLAGGACGALWLCAGHPAWSGLASLLLLLALAASALRDDPRLCVTTGLFSMVGYAWVAHSVTAGASGGIGPATVSAGWGNGVTLGHLAAITCATAFASTSARRGWAARLQRVRDPVTGLMSEAALKAFLLRETQRSRLEGRPLSLALIQVERLAELTEGPRADMVAAILQGLAALLRDSCRTTDALAHLGEGTFGVAFVDSAHPHLQSRLEELREHVLGLEIRPGPGEPAVQIGLRTGLASFPGESSQVPELLSLADARMRGAA